MIWILFIGTMALSLWAAWRVKAVYARYNQGIVRSGLTGAEVAAEILRRKGIYDVEITQGEGMLFNLATLPVEFDASRRAKAVLADFGFIAPGAEAIGVKKVLDAAAWTYVAAFITSLAYFLWHLLPLLMGGNRSRD